MAAVKELLRAENDGTLSFGTTPSRQRQRKITLNLRVISIR